MSESLSGAIRKVRDRESFYDGLMIGVLLGFSSMGLLFAVMAAAGVYGG